MKKNILILAFLAIVLSANSCKKNEASETKIDFTQSYEDAALTLSNAQKKYDQAVASNDPVRIEAAKQELQAAQTKYVESKKIYVAQGGTVKAEYENYSSIATQTLGTQASNTVKNIVRGKDSLITGKVSAAVENRANAVQKQVNDEKARITQETKKKVADVKASADKTKEDFKKSAEETKKSANEEINKAKQSLNSLLGK